MEYPAEGLSPTQRVLVTTGVLALAVLGVEWLHNDPVDKTAVKAANEQIEILETHDVRNDEYYKEIASRQSDRADAEAKLANARQRIMYELAATTISLGSSAIIGIRRRRLQDILDAED